MDIEERRKAIKFIVSDVYAPAVKQELQRFIDRFQAGYKDAHALSQIIGRPVPMDKTILDLRPLNDKLIDNLINYEVIIENSKNANSKTVKKPETKDLSKEAS